MCVSVQPLPKQALGGESMRSLLLTGKGMELESPAPRKKTWALSQWPRRPSCTVNHGCEDGHGNPYEKIPDQAIMGYRIRTDRWAYSELQHKCRLISFGIFYRKCGENGELPLKNDDFRLKSSH